MKYASINAGNTLVYFVANYTGSDFPAFRSAYEAENPGKTLVSLGFSTFPDGQGWVQESNQIAPADGLPKGMADILPGIMAAIQFKTDQLEYDGTVTFKGEQFPSNHDVRDDVVLLAVSVSMDAGFASELLPLRVNSIDGSEVTIANVTEAKEFALIMLNPMKSIYAGNADQLAAVQAMLNVTQLMQYVDPR